MTASAIVGEIHAEMERAVTRAKSCFFDRYGGVIALFDHARLSLLETLLRMVTERMYIIGRLDEAETPETELVWRTFDADQTTRQHRTMRMFVNRLNGSDVVQYNHERFRTTTFLLRSVTPESVSDVDAQMRRCEDAVTAHDALMDGSYSGLNITLDDPGTAEEEWTRCRLLELLITAIRHRAYAWGRIEQTASDAPAMALRAVELTTVFRHASDDSGVYDLFEWASEPMPVDIGSGPMEADPDWPLDVSSARAA